jgi:Putative zinc-finger
MTNNNHKNSSCGFAEQLVSYLYEEIDGTEKTVFEAHLKNCSNCSDEFAAFSGVHFSINNWKIKDFSNLETPLIEIPYKDSVTPTKTQEISGVTDSWLSGLRALFSFSPRAWSLATASFAVLAVCAVIALFAFNSRQPNDVATANKNQIKPIIAPTVENTPPETNVNSNENNQSEKQPKQQVEPKSSQPELATEQNPKNIRPIKASTNPRPVQKVENIRKNNDIKNKQNKDKVAPKILTEPDDEDDTLRLAELFEEIGTR